MITLFDAQRSTQNVDRALDAGRAESTSLIPMIAMCMIDPLGTKAFDMGKRTVAAAMIEEYAHLESRAPDKSREFQSYLLDQYLGQLEKATGQYL